MRNYKFLLVPLALFLFGVQSPRASAQIDPGLFPVGTLPFDPGDTFDPEKLTQIGTVQAGGGTETWRGVTEDLSTWVVYDHKMAPGSNDGTSTVLRVDDNLAHDGCSSVPTPPTNGTSWAVYNAVAHERPELVGVRYVVGTSEAWYLSDRFRYGGTPGSYLVVHLDPDAKYDSAWTHYISVTR